MSRAVVLSIVLICVLWCALNASPASGDAVPISPGSWTLAILPDTQIYAQSFPQHYTKQTEWIRDHVASHNIKYVLHEGDITNNNVVAQWNNAVTSMNVLNGHIPYAMAPGNHDYGTSGSSDNRISLFNQTGYFGPGSFYANQPSIGGFFEAGKTDNTYHTFNAGGEDWLVLALEWGPRDEVVAWANQIVANHPDHKAMLVTHAYMYYDETIYDWATKGSSQSWNPHSYPFVANGTAGSVNDGQQLWDKLVKKHENFEFVFNGHVLNDGTGYRSTLGDGGNVVHQMLANYQTKTQGGMGDMRLLEFKTDGTVEVRTYSPVLDRHDTAFDQQFTLKRGELHGPLQPPVISHAVAANLVANLPTDPELNVYTAVTVPQFSAPGVGTGQLNRGDFQVYVDGAGLTYSEGILLASITQHERSDFVGRRASVEAGRNPYGDGLVSLSIMEAGGQPVAPLNEINFNTSIAWFQFAAGWQGAHVNANGTIAAANRVNQSMVTRTGAGRHRVDLGVDSRTDGMLFAIANNNANIVAQTGPFTDGSGWDIRIDDNAADHAATGEDRDWSFLYLPFDTKGLIGGVYDGTAATPTHIASAGNFTMNRLATGQYELTVPGETPQTGMLLLSVAHRATSTVTAPDDNILTYQASPSGSFLINSYDLPTLNLQNTRFAWAFISFDDPLEPFFLAGDYNRDGVVNASDYVQWRSQYGMTGDGLSADGNRDGTVDTADFIVWRKSASNAAAAAAAGAVPEPSCLSIAIYAVLSFAVRLR